MPWTCFNLMVTFAISGLWHGASWNFVLWGIYWGLLIVIQRVLESLGVTIKMPGWSKVVLTFAAACFGWLLFREHDLGQIAHDLAQSPFGASLEQWRMAAYFCILVLDLCLTTDHSFAGNWDPRLANRNQTLRAQPFRAGNICRRIAFARDRHDPQHRDLGLHLFSILARRSAHEKFSNRVSN